MRCALLIPAALVLLGTTTPAGEGREEPNRTLKGISAQMHKVKDKLEAEHHGARVRLTQQEILKRLDELIKKIEEAQQPPNDGKPDPGKEPKPQRGPKRTSANPNNQGRPQPGSAQNPSSPMQEEFLTSGGKPPTGMHKTRAELSAVGGKWGELPAKLRRRIIQVRSAEFPDRYRRMIEIYLMAIAEEDER